MGSLEREAITNTQPQTHNRTPLHSTPLHSTPLHSTQSLTHALMRPPSPSLTFTALSRGTPHLTSPHLTSPHLTLLTHSGAEDGLRLQTSSFACGFLRPFCLGDAGELFVHSCGYSCKKSQPLHTGNLLADGAPNNSMDWRMFFHSSIPSVRCLQMFNSYT